MQGLSLSIPAGTSCALVGTSGSGKSTVLRLLFRFYEPESGTLSVAGRSITDFTMKSLRAKIGEVGPGICVCLDQAQLGPCCDHSDDQSVPSKSLSLLTL